MRIQSVLRLAFRGPMLVVTIGPVMGVGIALSLARATEIWFAAIALTARQPLCSRRLKVLQSGDTRRDRARVARASYLSRSFRICSYCSRVISPAAYRRLSVSSGVVCD